MLKKLTRRRRDWGIPLSDAIPLLAAKPKREKKPPPPPSDTPNMCVTVNVDPGETSGWSIEKCGLLLDHGHCDVFGDEPMRVLERAVRIGKAEGLKVVLVVERPYYVKAGTSTGIGTGEKIWRVRAARVGIRRQVRAWPSRWRSVALGKGWGSKQREKTREQEQKVARFVLRTTEPIHPDEAPAICMGLWSSHAGEVREKLEPKPRKPKAGKAA